MPSPGEYAAQASIQDGEWMVRVTDLKQFEYCPRVVYYEYCLPRLRPTTYKMAAGIAAQDRVNELEERRSLRAYGIASGTRHFHVSLQSPSLRCSGQVDMVIETEEKGPHRLIPVDFKLTRREPGRHWRLQIACYALMLEECWGLPVQEGFLYLIPAKESVPVAVTPRLRRDAVRTLEEIRQMVAAERMPAPVKARARCVNCEFRRFCNDVL